MDNNIAVNSKATVSYMPRVFGWMFYGMIVSGLLALFLSTNAFLLNLIFGNAIVYYGLLISQLIIVFGLSGMINKLNTVMAFALFTLYSALTGITLTVILLVYSGTLIAGAFMMAASIFGIMAVVGYTTKINLSRLGVFFMFAVLGVFAVGIANIFLKSDTLSLVLSYVTILVFGGLTAYDMQRIKEQNAVGMTENKYAIVDALGMYINFINIFLSLLNILDRD